MWSTAASLFTLQRLGTDVFPQHIGDLEVPSGFDLIDVAVAPGDQVAAVAMAQSSTSIVEVCLLCLRSKEVLLTLGGGDSTLRQIFWLPRDTAAEESADLLLAGDDGYLSAVSFAGGYRRIVQRREALATQQMNEFRGTLRNIQAAPSGGPLMESPSAERLVMALYEAENRVVAFQLRTLIAETFVEIPESFHNFSVVGLLNRPHRDGISSDSASENFDVVGLHTSQLQSTGIEFVVLSSGREAPTTIGSLSGFFRDSAWHFENVTATATACSHDWGVAVGNTNTGHYGLLLFELRTAQAAVQVTLGKADRSSKDGALPLLVLSDGLGAICLNGTVVHIFAKPEFEYTKTQTA
mmetsp:Transcript_193/g.490  ORF Transcript_193/g.490 Transcript_193/m.490 type:complete len:353 (+) Transcript_193:163-1221(+)